MSKKTEATALVPVVGSILAWESQAAGFWKTKIGRVVKLPHPGTDKRTSESKIRLEILATYMPPTTPWMRPAILTDKGAERIIPKLGIKTFQKRSMKPLKIGLVNPSQVRIPQAWELKLTEAR